MRTSMILKRSHNLSRYVELPNYYTKFAHEQPAEIRSLGRELKPYARTLRYKELFESYDFFCVYKWESVQNKDTRFHIRNVWQSFHSDIPKGTNSLFVKERMSCPSMDSLLGRKIYGDDTPMLRMSWHRTNEIDSIIKLLEKVYAKENVFHLHSVGISLPQHPIILKQLQPLLETTSQNFDYEKLMSIAKKHQNNQSKDKIKVETLLQGLAQRSIVTPLLLKDGQWLVLMPKEKK